MCKIKTSHSSLRAFYRLITLVICLSAIFSCDLSSGTDGTSDTDGTDGSQEETHITLDTATPAEDSALASGDDYTFDITYFLSDSDYDETSEYELQVYLSGDGSSSYSDCGSHTLAVTGSGDGSDSISGELWIPPDHEPPYTVEIDLFRYSEGSGTPYQLASDKITYN